MVSLAQLRTPYTDDEALELIIAKLQGAGFNATSWGTNSLQRKFLRYGSFIYSELTKLVAALVDLGYNDTSVDDALTEFSKSRFGNTRMPGQRTVGEFVFRNYGDVSQSIEIGSAVVAWTSDEGTQYTFRNISAPPDDGIGHRLHPGTSVSLTVEAETVGDSNIPTNAALKLVTAIAGVTVANPPVAGSSVWYTTTGVDEESDDRLRLRNSTKWATLNAGESTEDAVTHYCLTASAAVARVSIQEQASPHWQFVANVASVDGSVGLNDVYLCTVELQRHFFNNVTCDALGAIPVGVSPTGTVYHSPQFSAAEALVAITRSLRTFLRAAPIGGFSYGGGLSNVVRLQEIGTAIEDARINGVKCVEAVVLTGTDVALHVYDVPIVGSLSGLTFTQAGA
jgi:hypothetical protein